ncbi:hypothetical protein [Clostridium estertheticum]|uniref:hypothetical protein n=1 Tax=Clostridium estertheticum TaxID=238834 RepID=UPI001CF3CFF8|nr:hypothetical protein [Clostridium estertheticum]MCB2362185.1 hypothetical protein [Clostridium estertheticum]
MEMKFCYNGVLSEKELDVKNPIIFMSNSKFPANYNSQEIIDSSTVLSNMVKVKLKRMNAKFTIGSSKKNMHIYEESANIMDARARLGLIIGHENELVLGEYNSPRGDKYSALFDILKEILYKKGFKSYQNKNNEVRFNIKFEKIDIFVDCCNEVIALNQQNKLELKVSNEFYTISKKKNNENFYEYFFKTFYTYKPDKIIVNPYKLIAQEIISATPEQLSDISDKLDTVNTLLENKKIQLATIQKL